MSAAEHEPVDPDEIWMLVLDVPADVDLPEKRATLGAMRDTAETLAEYAAERGTGEVDDSAWSADAYDEQIALADVAAADRDYVADRMRNVLDTHGYDSVRLVYQKR